MKHSERALELMYCGESQAIVVLSRKIFAAPPMLCDAARIGGKTAKRFLYADGKAELFPKSSGRADVMFKLISTT